MPDPPLAAACRPAKDRYRRGEPVAVAVELTNRTNRTITVLASGVPWTYHHAIRFTVLDGGEFENRLWVFDPPDGPDTTIPSGATASGELDLAQYLYSKDDKSINESSGTYRVGAEVIALASTGGEDEPYERLELTCEPFTITVEP